VIQRMSSRLGLSQSCSGASDDIMLLLKSSVSWCGLRTSPSILTSIKDSGVDLAALADPE
jgi:hypothetical protein